jgi:hypothetical protein
MTLLAIIALAVLFSRWAADDIRAGDIAKSVIDIVGIVLLVWVFVRGGAG